MKTNNPMKTQYVIKTIELHTGENHPVYLVFSVSEDGKQKLVGRYRSLSFAMDAVRRLTALDEAQERKTETGLSELDDFLKDHPELAQALGSAAKDYAEKKRRTDALKARRQELGEAIAEFDKAVCLAQRTINSLKGEMLRIQKERKAAVAELQSVVRQIGAGE